MRVTSPLGISALLCSALANAMDCNRPYLGKLDYETLKQIIIECQAKSIDALLPLLPEQYRKSYALIYQSKSPENSAVDQKNPRVIIFGDDAKLLMSFTTNPEKPFFQQMQLIQYRDDNNENEFHSLEFTPEGKVIEDERGTIRRARKKYYHAPSACLGCHDGATRPNWDSYRFWPGVYGSNDDDFSVVFAIDGTDVERSNLKELKKRRNEGRLRFLAWPDEGPTAGEVAPYRDLQKQLANGSEQGIALRPNLRLTKLTMGLNAKRVFKKLKASPNYERLKYRLAAALLNDSLYAIRQTCKPIPETPLRYGQAKDLIQATSNYKKHRSGIKAEIKPDGDMKPNSFGSDTTERIARLLAIAKLFKFDPAIYSIGIDPSSFAINDGDQMMDDLLLSEILKDIAKTDPEVKKRLKFNFNVDSPQVSLVHNEDDRYFASKIDQMEASLNLNSTIYGEICEIVKKKLPKEEIWPRDDPKHVEKAKGDPNCLQAESKQPMPKANEYDVMSVRATVVFQACASCHKSEFDAKNAGKYGVSPRIEFDEPALLLKRLGQEARLSERILATASNGTMPPDQKLTESEKKAIQDFIKSLKK